MQENTHSSSSTSSSRKRKSKGESVKISQRYLIFGFLFVFIFLISILEVFFLSTGARGDKWAEIEKNHKKSDTIIKTPKRGDIYAATGELLHTTIPYYSVKFDFQSEGYLLLCSDIIEREVNGEKIRKYQKNKKKEQEVLSKLVEALFRAVPRLNETKNKKEILSDWIKKSRKKRGNRGVWLLRGFYFLEEEYSDFNRNIKILFSPKSDKTKKNDYLYINRSMKSSLSYKKASPNGVSMDNFLGVDEVRVKNNKTISNAGIESFYNEYLAGKTGLAEKKYIKNKYSEITIKNPENGASIYTTIDMGLQDVLNEQVLELMHTYKPHFIMAAVMECNTGRIVAQSCKKMEGANSKIEEDYNMIARSLIEPGSVIKTISMLAALEDGVIKGADEPIDIGTKPYVLYQKKKIHTHQKGLVTAKDIIAISDNYGISKIILKGYENNPEKFVNRIKALGLDINLREDPNFRDFSNAYMPRVKSPEDKDWTAISLPSMAYGYTNFIPPLYLLSIYNMIANGGDFMRPYMVEKIINSKGKTIYERKPEALRKNVLKPSTCKEITKMLRAVMNEEGKCKGTGRYINRFKDVAHTIAGKTGTTLYFDSKTKQYVETEKNYSFCSFFPVDNPRYTVYAYIARPRENKVHISSGRSAALVSVAIARADKKRRTQLNFREEVKQGLFKDKKEIKEDSVLTDLTQDVSLKKMPNLIGYSLSSASFLLQRRGVNIVVRGHGYVQSQSKASGSTIREGETIILTLGTKNRK